MIITKNEPFTTEEVAKLSEEFEVYIKTVIDIDKKICSAGMNRHFDFNSFINIRPRDNNTKNEIQSENIKEVYKELSEYFFRELA
ncbi:MAG: hypothetical protein COY80_03970 [Candidatus Pacebacteria bacterium CG_4_10_14_0_8_um_filter_42_14]|nr:MAG: hypothetical protein COY80_03970 [Candidatus Pacebacteria bacterium CG_4_10_14_0_8_um_filter_42_14]